MAEENTPTPVPVAVSESVTGADATAMMTMPHSAEDMSKAPAPIALSTKLPPVPTPEAHFKDSALADEVGLPRVVGSLSHLEPEVSHLGPTKMPDHLTAQTDVAHILQEVRLPERRDFRASGDVAKNALTMSMPQAVEAPPVTIAMPSLDAGVAAQAAATSVERNNETVQSVHTLKNDLQTVVQEQKVSFVHAVALEEDKRRERAENKARNDPASAQRSARIVGALITVVVLVLTGAAALFGVYTVMQQRSPNTVMPASTGSLLFSEQSLAMNIDAQSGSDIKQAIARLRSSNSAPVGSIVRIVPTVTDTDPTTHASITRQATTQEFLKALGLHTPDDLARSLESTFFLGLHTTNKVAPVMVFPVVSYDRAFAAMLQWEPSMNTDLAPLFTSVPTLMKDATDGSLKPRTFSDTVMRNFDARVLKDDSGAVVLYYSFPTPKLLIIAESPYSFAELLSRLQASRQL